MHVRAQIIILSAFRCWHGVLNRYLTFACFCCLLFPIPLSGLTLT